MSRVDLIERAVAPEAVAAPEGEPVLRTRIAQHLVGHRYVVLQQRGDVVLREGRRPGARQRDAEDQERREIQRRQGSDGHARTSAGAGLPWVGIIETIPRPVDSIFYNRAGGLRRRTA